MRVGKHITETRRMLIASRGRRTITLITMDTIIIALKHYFEGDNMVDNLNHLAEMVDDEVNESNVYDWLDSLLATMEEIDSDDESSDGESGIEDDETVEAEWNESESGPDAPDLGEFSCIACCDDVRQKGCWGCDTCGLNVCYDCAVNINGVISCGLVCLEDANQGMKLCGTCDEFECEDKIGFCEQCRETICDSCLDGVDIENMGHKCRRC